MNALVLNILRKGRKMQEYCSHLDFKTKNVKNSFLILTYQQKDKLLLINIIMLNSLRWINLIT